ncbi:hypothetical protein J2X20_002567 [Pelomonas saccharophila]|uniref:Uncharacterized protein n=1 Tax=Roseateles saccharophilus TaxID=304 RepID=A0ABU1YM21_ROSSA|nr:hypothetical protein [Roseateles saccharophilus]MDR7269909.1 hypothetical protein [Roseateles saccharophilus]
MSKSLRALLACAAIAFVTTAANAAPQRGLTSALAEALGGGVASGDNTAEQVKPKKPK